MARIGGRAKIGLACPVQLGGGPAQKVNNKRWAGVSSPPTPPIATDHGQWYFTIRFIGKVIEHTALFIEKYIRSRATASHQLPILERRAIGICEVTNSSTFDAIDYARQRSGQRELSAKSTERLRNLH